METMSKHSVVEAKNQLSALIERALKGERVVITRHGHDVVELRPVGASATTMAPLEDDAIRWLTDRRPQGLATGEAADETVRRIRSEAEH